MIETSSCCEVCILFHAKRAGDIKQDIKRLNVAAGKGLNLMSELVLGSN